MDRGKCGAVFLCLSTFLPQAARAADEVLDRAVVRNRLFKVAGRAELGLSAGTSVADGLTTHQTVGITSTFNFVETLAAEARGTLAFGRHTGLAGRVASDFLRRDPTRGEVGTADDLSNLWEMGSNLMAGIRWSPIYGKLSLFADRPLHFQAYGWLGAGAGTLHRESLVYCLSPSLDANGSPTGACGNWLVENRIAPLASAAVGMRFFTGQNGAIKLEAQDFAFNDEYRININRSAAQTGDTNQGSVIRSGLTQIWTINLGYALIF